MVDIKALELQERRAWAQALKLLRERQGKTQEQAAEALNYSLTAWQNYERAQRKFTPELIEKVTRALGATPDELQKLRNELEEPTEFAATESRAALELPMDGKVRAGARGLEVYDAGPPVMIDFSRYFGEEWRVLQLAGDSMIPYAEPGGYVTYSTTRAPQRNKGCVIRMKTGEYYVKRFDFIRDGRLNVTELHPAERPLEFSMADVEGVYAIGLRLD